MHRDQTGHVGAVQRLGGVRAVRQHGGRAAHVQTQVGGQRLGAGGALQQTGEQGPGEPDVGGQLPAAAHQLGGRDARGADQRLLRQRGQRLRALLHPDGAERLRPGPDADGQAAAQAELGVRLDRDRGVRAAQVLEDAPLAELGQVRLRALPAEDGEPAQVVDLVGVGGAGVGQHPAGGVLDRDDAVGEHGDGLGEGEEVARVGLGGAGRVRGVRAGDDRPGQRVQVLPAGLAAHRQQGHARLGGGLAQRVGLAGAVQLDRDGGRAGPAGGAQGGEGGAAAGADREDELAGGGGRRVLRVEDRDVAHRDVQPLRGGLEFDQGLAEGHQQLAERQAGGGHSGPPSSARTTLCG